MVHKEGRITAERQATGKRKGQWLFNRATVRSLDRLYDEFESRAHRPRTGGERPDGRRARVRDRAGVVAPPPVPGWLRSRVGPAATISLAVYQVLGLVLLALLIVPVYRLVVWPIVRLALAPDALAGVSRQTIGRSPSWVRPLGWLAVVWMLVAGRDDPRLADGDRGPLLAVLVPALLARGGRSPPIT